MASRKVQSTPILKPREVIKFLEDFQSFEGLYYVYYCGITLHSEDADMLHSEDADMHTIKFIQAAV